MSRVPSLRAPGSNAPLRPQRATTRERQYQAARLNELPDMLHHVSIVCQQTNSPFQRSSCWKGPPIFDGGDGGELNPSSRGRPTRTSTSLAGVWISPGVPPPTESPTGQPISLEPPVSASGRPHPDFTAPDPARRGEAWDRRSHD